MATLTAPRAGGRHRRRRPSVPARVGAWLRRPHPALHDYATSFAARAACWALPGAIVVCAITTKGTGG